MRNKILKIDDLDNVAVLLKDLSAGNNVVVNDSVLNVNEDISLGHKIALKDLSLIHI